jgi:hypothetical protein
MELAAIGTKFVFSGTDTYWSNQVTMKSLFRDNIAPYLQEKKANSASLQTRSR